MINRTAVGTGVQAHGGAAALGLLLASICGVILAVGLGLVLISGTAASQPRTTTTTLDVNDGETLTEDNITSGMFTGSGGKFSFALSPSMTFNINDGGEIGPVGGTSTDPDTPFDFDGATVNINGGGEFSSNNSSFRNSVVSNVQLNVFAGGSVGSNFDALGGSTVNISGGSVEKSFDARDGSTVNIADGSVGTFFDAHDGSTVNISGGNMGGGIRAHNGSTVTITSGTVDNVNANKGSTVTISGGSIGDWFRARNGSTVTITGNDFMLNGSSVTSIDSMGLFGGAFRAAFSGVLADGSAFIFAPKRGARIESGTTTLNTVDVPPADITPQVVSSGDAPSKGLRAGQTLTITGDAEVRDGFEAIGGTLNIEGGSVGRELTTVNSVVNISGGSVGRGFHALSGSTVNIFGGKFVFNGSKVESIDSVIGFSDVFSGVLADGSAFILSGALVDLIPTATTTLNTVDVPPADTTPQMVSSGDAPSKGLRAGQTLTITGDAEVRDGFEAIGGTLNIEAGIVGDDLAALNTDINITGGSVGDGFRVLSGTTLNISGGSVGGSFSAFDGSVVTISGGSVGGGVGTGFDAHSGSTVNITGGTVSDSFEVKSGSTINISGGVVDDTFSGQSGGTMNLSVTHVSIDGDDLDLAIGETVEITRRNENLLEATLADGSSFDLYLDPERGSGEVKFEDKIPADAKLNVTRVEQEQR